MLLMKCYENIVNEKVDIKLAALQSRTAHTCTVCDRCYNLFFLYILPLIYALGSQISHSEFFNIKNDNCWFSLSSHKKVNPKLLSQKKNTNTTGCRKVQDILLVQVSGLYRIVY